MHLVDLNNFFQKGLSADPESIALISRRAQWSWRELDEMTDRLAKNYLALGLRPGDRMASLMPNRWELVVHYLACMRAGLVMTPLNYRYMTPEIDHALELSGAVALLANAEREEDLAATNLVSELPLGVIYFEGKGSEKLSIEDMLTTDPLEIELPKIDPSDPIAIFFTSGSTGKPKGVTQSLETLGWMCGNFVDKFSLTDTDIVLPGSSISHIGGLCCSLTTLSDGGQLIIARTFDSEEILPILRDFKPTLFGMIPASLFELIKDEHAVHDDFASLRLCVSGGDKVSRVLEQEFLDKAGIIVHELYGMTETGNIFFNPDKTKEHLRSVGTLPIGIQASIRDDDGEEVGVNVPGNLWVKSNCTTIGYWNNEEATREAMDEDGWFDTGDVMKVDESGYYWFSGRKKQIIVHNGSNICPQEVEEALQSHEAVAHAGVVGVHDLVHGENVVAYVTFQEDHRADPQDIIEFSRTIVGYKAPEEIVVLDEMPFNATGKVDRVTLKRLAEDTHHIDLTPAS